MSKKLNSNCPCIQESCNKHGDCVACIEEHRAHKKHVPECMQPIIRGTVKKLAEKVEYDVKEGRPLPSES